jgi:thiamine biosynthesis lipoprotein
MASPIELWIADDPPDAASAAAEAADIFAAVEAACTRFDPESPLMRLNDSPGRWVQIPPYCYRALAAACRAWRITGGRFDPRVLMALVGLGYDGTLAFEPGTVRRPPAAPARPVPAGPFLERRPRRSEARLLGDPLDLGGIGKGLAVRWAAGALSRRSANFLLNAGGDCACRGAGPDGTGWRVGVEDPAGGGSPVAVLAVADRAVCTSSVRRRHWLAGEEAVHHLIDPRTGASAGSGLMAVTVVGPDPAWAEVWAKALFIEGRAGVAGLADARHVAALWVGEDGRIGWSQRLRPHLLWCGVA